MTHALYPLTPRDRVCIVGKTGSGKSTFTKDLCRELRAQKVRTIVVDPHGEYSEDCQLLEGMKPGPLRNSCTVSELERNVEWLRDPALSMAVTFRPDAEWDEIAEEVDSLVRAVRIEQERNGGKMPLVLVFEEVGELRRYVEDTLNRVATGFRKYGVTAVLVAQRMTGIPKTARVQASQIVSFLQDDDEDIQALVSKFGAARAERIRSLKPGECEHWREGATTKTDNVRSLRKAG